MKRTVLTGLTIVGVGLGAVATASADTYPRDLFENKKELKQQHQKLVAPVAKQHDWITQGGTQMPVSTVKLGDTKYSVLFSCKPHECPAEQLITLMGPKGKHSTGAFVENSGDLSDGPEKSDITWLGQPNSGQRSYMAAYLFGSGAD